MSAQLKNILERTSKITPFNGQINNETESKTSLDSLKLLKGKIPPHLIYVLDAFEQTNKSQQFEASSKILELVLYAQGKLRHEKKAYNWLSSGKVPQTTTDSISSMSQFKTKCEDTAKAFEALKKVKDDEQSNQDNLIKNPSNNKFHQKADRLSNKKDEAQTKYQKKLEQFLDTLNGLILGIGSEKL